MPDGSCLLTLVEYLYLDDVQEQSVSHSLYQAALHCGLQRLVTRCEAHYAHQLDLQLLSWPGGLPAGKHIQGASANKHGGSGLKDSFVKPSGNYILSIRRSHASELPFLTMFYHVLCCDTQGLLRHSVRLSLTASSRGLTSQSSRTGNSSCSFVCMPWLSILQQHKAGEACTQTVTVTVAWVPLPTSCPAGTAAARFAAHLLISVLASSHSHVLTCMRPAVSAGHPGAP